jgi:hypothetical protein
MKDTCRSSSREAVGSPAPGFQLGCLMYHNSVVI